MDYKVTLNLPNTKFPMKAGLSANEPKILEFWQKNDVYGNIRSQSKGRPKYILHDGPPYANGNIHIGHALNKILKDIIVRFKTMYGFDSPYVPGWDCHGLPVEHQLFKELNITKEQISRVDFRKKAFNYAMKYVEIQKTEFIRLGVSGRWDRPYLTLDKKYESEIASSLAELVKRGYIYRGLKPVNWCWTCETALAEAEVEYEDKSSPSIYVRFRVIGPAILRDCPACGGTVSARAPRNDAGEPFDETYLIIWTTTPWTLYGNAAVAVHPEAEYSFVKTDKGTLIIASKLLPPVLKDIGVNPENTQTIKNVTGRDLEGLAYEHPFLSDNIARKVVLADYVSQEEGTGLVHTAPGHGQEDYETALKYKLPILMPVDKQGKFDQTIADFKGLRVLEANKLILEKLNAQGALLFSGQIQHSYPHCWRCKNPVIFRATKQWFLGIDHNDLRQKLTDVIEGQIHWVPQAGKERIKAMISIRPDWCLSRQRYWGLPIPSIVCLSCKEEVLSVEVIDSFAQNVKEYGSDVWFTQDTSVFIPKGFQCPHCAGKDFGRGEDILDVWFDSGVSCRAALKADPELDFPAALYLEGSDQHRGWFQASLIPSMAIENIPPFKTVLTHGFVVDGEGRKMSKSMGNVIAPQEIIKDYGADILRLWVSSSNYSEDIRISKDILSRLTEAYRKIRNTIRFLLANLYDFTPGKDDVSYEKLSEIDRFALSSAYALLKKVTRCYEEFEFYKIYQEIYQFCILLLSNFYLDILKDRLYTSRKDGLLRRSAQTALYEILVILTKSIAPFLPFTAEEIWQWIPKQRKEAESVHLAPWPKMRDNYIDDEGQNQWYNLIQFRDKVLKSIEEKRAAGIIGSSLEAKLIIGIAEENKFLKNFEHILSEVFIVSQVELEKAASEKIEVQKADGTKCPRCWVYSREIGRDASYPGVCPKCAVALK